MDVITIESKAYHELMGKIEKILRYVEKEEKAKTEYENRLVTNEELAEILGISKRTLQRMRSADRISYKMIYGRCYYALHDIEEAIRNKSLYCNPQNLKELRHNFELKYPVGTQGDDVVRQAVDAYEAAGRLIFAGEGQLYGTTEVARFPEGFLVLVGEGMPEEFTLQLRLLADGMDDRDKRTVSGGFQRKTGIGVEGDFADFNADGNKRSLAVLKQVIKMLAFFQTLTAHAHLLELIPLHLVGVNALEGLFLLYRIVRRIDTGGIQHLLIGGDIRCFEHLREYACAGNGTLKRHFEEVELCGVLELPHEVGEEVLQRIAVLVELQEALFMLGGGRNGFQSAFLVRTCDDFEILVFLILDQKDFLVFDFFVHIIMYLMAPTAVHGQK